MTNGVLADLTFLMRFSAKACNKNETAALSSAAECISLPSWGVGGVLRRKIPVLSALLGMYRYSAHECLCGPLLQSRSLRMRRLVHLESTEQKATERLSFKVFPFTCGVSAGGRKTRAKFPRFCLRSECEEEEAQEEGRPPAYRGFRKFSDRESPL